MRNEAKTATLAKLVPHLNSHEEIRSKLYATEEERKVVEHQLREKVSELQDANFEFRGTTKGKQIPICLY